MYVSKKYKDEEVRSIQIVNKFADVYMMFVTPATGDEEKKIIVGADLLEVGGQKHTFPRQRKDFHFKETVDLAGLEALLDRALLLTGEWATEIPRHHPKS